MALKKEVYLEVDKNLDPSDEEPESDDEFLLKKH